MVASICGISFEADSLPKLRQVRNRAKDVGIPATIATIMGAACALAYQVAGAVLSIFTRGNLSLIGAGFASSPFFYVPLALVAATAVGSLATVKICTSLIRQIHLS